MPSRSACLKTNSGYRREKVALQELQHSALCTMHEVECGTTENLDLQRGLEVIFGILITVMTEAALSIISPAMDFQIILLLILNFSLLKL